MLVVGIAGGTASGKTTLAQALNDHLGDLSTLLTHDRYYRTMPDAFRVRPTEYNFDHPDALETSRMVDDLEALRGGRAVRVPRYDFARHVREPERRWDELMPRPVVLVEGILVLHDPLLRACFDRSVFVHAPADLRLARRIRRDVAERGRQVEGVLAQYEATVRPMHRRFVEPSRFAADLVLDGTSPVAELVCSVLALTPL